MTDTQSSQITKLEKLHAAWLPMIEFLYGAAIPEAKLIGFEINTDIAKPVMVFPDEKHPQHYSIQMPARSFTNDVMLLADLLAEMVRGLSPIPANDASEYSVLCEGAGVYAGVAAIKQVFGEQTVDSYLDALQAQAFSFYDAFSYVAVLLADDPQAIKKLRTVQPELYKVKRADFATAEVTAEKKIQDILTFTFRA